MTERGSVSVSSSTSRIVYAGNNSLVTAYAVPFYFEENAHLNAIAKTAAGVETVVTLTNHTGAGNENGGTVRTAVAVPATSTLTIYREVPFTQATSYEENDAFPAASHERALDKLTTITQQLERRITNCIRGTEATPLSPIPSPTGTQQFVLSAASNLPPSWQELPVLAAGPVVATGSTQARFISDRFADVVNVKDFGAVGDGVTNDASAFQAAINYFGDFGTLHVPSGTYRLDSNPSIGTKALSYSVDPSVSFVGSGNIPTPSAGFGFYYNGKLKDSGFSLFKSSQETAATACFAKYSSAGGTGAYQNPACYAVGYKYSNAAESRVQGLYSEAIDAAGGQGSFVEGARVAGINATAGLQGDVYGIICVAQSGTSTLTPNSDFVIGCESETIKFGSVAPTPYSFNVGSFSANFLATCRAGVRTDAAFLCNPYNEVNQAPQVGFMVGPGQNVLSPASKSVEHTAFGCYQTGLAYGLDLSRGGYSFAAIAIPNNSPIRARNSAGNSENNILYLDASDICHVGADAAFLSLDAPLGMTDQVITGSAGAIAGYITVFINGTQRKMAFYAV